MKKILLLFASIFMCVFARADTISINWLTESGSVSQTTTCESGGDLILPTPPTKYGYTFVGWELLDYTPIEYLTSTGIQWINTGISPSIYTGFNIKFIQNNTIPDESPIGSRIAANNNQMIFFMGATDEIYVNIGTNSTRIDHPNFTFATLKTAVLQNRIFRLIETNTNQELINVDFNYVPATELSKSLPLYLFSANQNNQQNRPFEGRIYLCQIYDHDTLVRDMIPVLDSNGTPCMYDKVTRQFFYNQGTGNFIAGPVVQQ